ncbi:MAG TPA: SIS domain-containing protein [Clostridia bacterium]|nr:SIS domain-containing protein [Clostridia bacterium]
MANCTVTSHEEIKKTVANLLSRKKTDGGIKSIYFVACGGSKAGLNPGAYFLQHESSNLIVDNITANEFVHDVPRNVGKNTIVVTMSQMGNTKETVAAAELAKKKGAASITISVRNDVPIAKFSDAHLLYDEDLYTDVLNGCMVLTLRLGIELLNQIEGYKNYDLALESFEKLGMITEKAVEMVSERAREFAEECKAEPVIYTMGSGPSHYAAYMNCICLLMEMEWIHSNCIHSGEFFHGPFEITDMRTPFIVFENEGKTRVLDDRAIKFLKTYGKKIYIIDSKEFGINIIDDAVIDYFNGPLLWSVSLVYMKELAAAKRHPLMMRRYMYKVEY